MREYEEYTEICDGESILRTYSNVDQFWYIKLANDYAYHRLDGPAMIYANGNKHWYFYGKKHRTDGPAVEFPNGHKEWWQNGKLHRLDGPALELSSDRKSWYLDGTHIRSRQEFERLVRLKAFW